MSLADRPVALATDPYTKATGIDGDKGLRASRKGCARPAVVSTIFRSSVRFYRASATSMTHG